MSVLWRLTYHKHCNSTRICESFRALFLPYHFFSLKISEVWNGNTNIVRRMLFYGSILRMSSIHSGNTRHFSSRLAGVSLKNILIPVTEDLFYHMQENYISAFLEIRTCRFRTSCPSDTRPTDFQSVAFPRACARSATMVGT